MNEKARPPRSHSLVTTCRYNPVATCDRLHDLRKKNFSHRGQPWHKFERLLLDPLRGCKKVILDGLDESDLTVKDKADRTERPEISDEYSLSKVVSRPSAKIEDIVFNVTSERTDI